MLIHTMDMKDLESAVRDIIEEIYNKKYIGKLKVSKTPRGFKLDLALGFDDTPHTYAMEGNEKQFLKFVKCELMRAGWNGVEFSELHKIYFTRGCCEK